MCAYENRHSGEKRGFRTLNAEVREVLETENEVRIEDVNGQRYIGAGLDRGKRLEVHARPATTWART